MITLSILWMLIINNKYIYNLLIIMLFTIVGQNLININQIDMVKLLFNSYISYDQLVITVLIFSSLIVIWLISIYGELIYSNKLKNKINNEYLTIIFLLIIAMGTLTSTNHYLTLLVTIELQSLTLYILLTTNLPQSKFIWKRFSKVSLSYLINAATATALLIFGFSINSSLLIMISVLWKLGVMPVHAWSLPILDNQNNLTVALYLTIPKYGTLLVIGLIASQSNLATDLLINIGLINLTIGNLLGLLQYRYQRIITYSSLIQIGYIILILANLTFLSLSYFELYAFFTIMLLILWLTPTYNKINQNNLLPQQQLWTLTLVLYTVAGLPYFPLFWTKLDVLLTISSQVLVIALVSTLLSSLIYVRLIKYNNFYYTSPINYTNHQI